MTRTIRKTARAELDLIGIWEYSFEQWDADRADKYVDELDCGIRLLADNPELGVSRADVREGYRVLFINSHAISSCASSTSRWTREDTCRTQVPSPGYSRSVEPRTFQEILDRVAVGARELELVPAVQDLGATGGADAHVIAGGVDPLELEGYNSRMAAEAPTITGRVPGEPEHDESLVDWFLSLTPEERLAELESRVAFFNEARRNAGRQLPTNSRDS